MKAILVGVVAVMLLGGCMPGDDDDRRKYPPGYGVTPIPAPKITKPATKQPGYRPVPAPARKVK